MPEAIQIVSHIDLSIFQRGKKEGVLDEDISTNFCNSRLR